MGPILRGIAVYWFLLFTLRIIGRRAVNRMTPFELILLFLIGGISIQAIVADDRSLTNALIVVITVGMNHVAVAWLKQKSVGFRIFADGTPVFFVEGGEWHHQRMWRMRLQDQDVMAAARDKGIRKIDQIEMAIVERDGSISVFAKDEPDSRDALGERQRGENASGEVSGHIS